MCLHFHYGQTHTSSDPHMHIQPRAGAGAAPYPVAKGQKCISGVGAVSLALFRAFRPLIMSSSSVEDGCMQGRKCLEQSYKDMPPV